MARPVGVSVPATSGNLGAGFDVLGVSLDLRNEVWLEPWPGGLCLEIEGEGSRELSRGSDNLAVRTLKHFYRRSLSGLKIRLVNRIPLARGLGSSAAVRLGMALAANRYFRLGWKRERLLEETARLEGHPDNAAAAFCGGLCLSVWEGGILRTERWDMPKEWKAVLCIPEFQLSTEKARKILPKKVSLKDSVFNLSRALSFLAAVVRGKKDFLRWAMEDRLHQPYRARLIPGFHAVLDAALRSGAAGAALSGAGSSILAISAAPSAARRVGQAMCRAFRQKGKESRFCILDFDRRGVLELSDNG